jgi:hypothetical protein
VGGGMSVGALPVAAGGVGGAAGSAPPSPRNCHSLSLVGRRVLLCGGYEAAAPAQSAAASLGGGGSGSGGGGGGGGGSNGGGAGSSADSASGGGGAPLGGAEQQQHTSSGGSGGGGGATDGPAPLEPVVLDLDASLWLRPSVGVARYSARRGCFLPGPAGRYAHSALPFREHFLVVFGGFTSGRFAALAAEGGCVARGAPSATAAAGGPTWLSDVWVLDTRAMPQAAALLAGGLMEPARGTLSPRADCTGHALPPGFVPGDAYAEDAADALGAGASALRALLSGGGSGGGGGGGGNGRQPASAPP